MNPQTKKYVKECAKDKKVQGAIISYLTSCFAERRTPDSGDIWEWLEEKRFSFDIHRMLWGLSATDPPRSPTFCIEGDDLILLFDGSLIVVVLFRIRRRRIRAEPERGMLSLIHDTLILSGKVRTDMDNLMTTSPMASDLYPQCALGLRGVWYVFILCNIYTKSRPLDLAWHDSSQCNFYTTTARTYSHNTNWIQSWSPTLNRSRMFIIETRRSARLGETH